MPDMPFDAIALLKAGHRDVEAMFARIERREISSVDKEALARDIAQALTIQAQLLEEIAFPAFRAAGVHASILDPAEANQYAIQQLIDDLQDISRKGDTFDARIKALSNWVKRLIRIAETEMFPEARSSGADLAAIGLRLAARKAELTAGTDQA